MRYAYIKYGNVLDELNSIGTSPSNVAQGGPLAFAGGFLQMVGTDPALIMSVVSKRQSPMSLRRGSVQAQVFHRASRWQEIVAAFRMAFRTLRFKPDVVICVRDGWFLWAAWLVSRLAGAGLVHSRQRAIKVAGDSRRRRFIATFDAMVLRRADSVICHGPFARQQLLDIGVQESRVIEFDVGFEDLLAQMRSAVAAAVDARDYRRKRIVFVGRMEASKGVFDLFEACLPMLLAHDDVDLVFVGDGEARAPLQELARQKNLSSRVAFTGRIAHAQIGVQLDGALALATPTRHGLEGWPMAALEGLAVGVPVVGPDAGPFPFMIAHGVNGLLFAVNSVEDLRVKLQTLLADTALRARLARGALEYSDERARTFKAFATALREACDKAAHR